MPATRTKSGSGQRAIADAGQAILSVENRNPHRYRSIHDNSKRRKMVSEPGICYFLSEPI